MSDDAAGSIASEALAYESPRPVEVPAAAIGALALRLYGLKVLVDLVSAAAGTLIYFQTIEYPLWWLLGWCVLQAALAAGLLAFARPVARFVCGPDRIVLANVAAATWMTLIVAGVGLALAVFAAGDLINGLAGRWRAQMPVLDAETLMFVVVPAAKLGLGALLFFKPSLLVWPWLRRVEGR